MVDVAEDQRTSGHGVLGGKSGRHFNTRSQANCLLFLSYANHNYGLLATILSKNTGVSDGWMSIYIYIPISFSNMNISRFSWIRKTR